MPLSKEEYLYAPVNSIYSLVETFDISLGVFHKSYKKHDGPEFPEGTCT